MVESYGDGDNFCETIMDLSLGKKRLCSSCSSVFFDMNNTKPKCPKCGETFVFSHGSVKSGKARLSAKSKTSKVEKEMRAGELANDKDEIILSNDIEFEGSCDLGIIDGI